jgi:hypothetical protein
MAGFARMASLRTAGGALPLAAALLPALAQGDPLIAAPAQPGLAPAEPGKAPAEPLPPPGSAATAATDPPAAGSEGWTAFASFRTRQEAWGWFGDREALRHW